MLQDKYLPSFHFSEKHSLVIHSSPAKIFPFVQSLDVGGSSIIRMLFWLRGIPASMMSLNGLAKGKFIILEELPTEELIIGLIGRFWKPSGDLQHFDPAEFTSLNPPGCAKASWSFQLIPYKDSTLLETETRIYCTTESSRKDFSKYWFVVKPFSGLIRKEMLKSIKQKAEAN